MPIRRSKSRPNYFADGGTLTAPRSAVLAYRVSTPKLSGLMADQLRADIIEGALSAGSNLPPQSDLMRSFGVSRESVREALRILEAETLIKSNGRGAAYVVQPLTGDGFLARYAGYYLQSQRVTNADAFAARSPIELWSVRQLAAKEGGACAKLANKISEIRRHLDQGMTEEVAAGIARFHALIVELAGNSTLVLLNGLLLELIIQHQSTFLRRHEISDQILRSQSQICLRSFERLIEGIGRGDGDGALRHWTRHLENANRAWLRPEEAAWVVDALAPLV